VLDRLVKECFEGENVATETVRKKLREIKGQDEKIASYVELGDEDFTFFFTAIEKLLSPLISLSKKGLRGAIHPAVCFCRRRQPQTSDGEREISL
jgi:hypothetical protein